LTLKQQTDNTMSPIRTARIPDLAEVEAIVREAITHMQARNIDQWDEIYPDRKTLETDIRQQEMHVIESGARICGFIIANNDQSPEYSEVNWTMGGRVLVIHRLTVAPDCQSQGLAQQLMRYAESLAKMNGYDTIRLDAFADNPRALRLYELLGYRRAGMVRFRKGQFFCYEKGIVAEYS